VVHQQERHRHGVALRFVALHEQRHQGLGGGLPRRPFLGPNHRRRLPRLRVTDAAEALDGRRANGCVLVLGEADQRLDGRLATAFREPGGRTETGRGVAAREIRQRRDARRGAETTETTRGRRTDPGIAVIGLRGSDEHGFGAGIVERPHGLEQADLQCTQARAFKTIARPFEREKLEHRHESGRTERLETGTDRSEPPPLVRVERTNVGAHGLDGPKCFGVSRALGNHGLLEALTIGDGQSRFTDDEAWLGVRRGRPTDDEGGSDEQRRDGQLGTDHHSASHQAAAPLVVRIVFVPQ
jgi:hypothetical protein